ncbi:MAG: sigma-54 dependent transcriptional regulator [Deltaproteobacteria bacterium]|nr:sigma-54 dependent transcriptional regulator [Deltaproteobacteria bacterium]
MADKSGDQERHTILFVDDEPDILKLIEYTLGNDYDVLTAQSGADGLEILRKRDVSLIIADQRMPQMSGAQFLDQSVALRPSAIRIILTGYTDIDSAIDAINTGKVYRYLTKPWEEADLHQNIKTAIEAYELGRDNRKLTSELQDLTARLMRENVELKREVVGHYTFDQIVGRSPAMQETFELLTRVIDSSTTVLITGETGTGKELIARAIHYNSPRRSKPFVAQNCGALMENLLESELFGHRKGAFTGAVEDKKGLFEVADGGTIFLDEIGDMPMPLQVRLLRVLQDGEIKRVGDATSRKVDVRVISATNRNLEAAVKSKQFREDLYYRLHVFPIHVPPLRERREDIPVLVEHFFEKYGKRDQKSVPGISPEALDLLQAYHFPGNVRELENEVQRVMALVPAGETIAPAQLSDKMKQASAQSGDEQDVVAEEGAGWSGSLKERVQSFERTVIVRELNRHGWNRTQTAKDLGISLRPFMEKLKRYRITEKEREK